MRRLIRHIEQSLYKHECVIVPGLGAFIKHRVSSMIDEAKGLIYPGKSVLSFNSAIVRSDGVLVESYREAFAMNYKRALALLEKDVEELTNALRTTSVVTLGTIGRLSMDRAGGQITFYPNPDHPFSTAQYGLTPVAQLPALPHRSAEMEALSPSAKQDVYYLPIHLKTVKYAAAAAALIAMTLLVPTKSIEIPGKGYHAGFLTAFDEGRSTVEPTTETATVEVTKEETPAIASPFVTHETAPRIGSLPIVTTPSGSTRYYVVIATFKTIRGVEKFLVGEDLQAFPNAGVVTHTGPNPNYKIYAAAFDTNEEAMRFARTTLAETRGKDSAWVFKSN